MYIMKKILFTILAMGLFLNISGLKGNCANIVYPKSNNVTINSPRTFFIGSENPNKHLTINGEDVEIDSSGGFWHTVNLNVGENTFIISNEKETQTFKITRDNTEQQKPVAPVFTAYKTPIVIELKDDNIPLRSTPVDFGINRLQHLQKGIKFTAIGEMGDFYKVQLARDDYGWIAKNSGIQTTEKTLKPAKIESFSYSEEQDKRIFKIKLNQKVPYILFDNDGLDLTIYSVENYPYSKYEYHIPPIGRNFGFTSYYKSDNELVIEVNNPPQILNSNQPLNGIKITIDPGHGGSEFGAIGCLGDKEKDINLAISNKLKDKLENSGAIVYMTRTDDSEVSLLDRVKNSNNEHSQIFISIHNNALPDSMADRKATGSETYYFYPQSRALAKSLLNSITSELSLKNNGAKQQSFAVVRNTNTPAALIELGYIINPEDNAKLMDSDFQDKAAEAIKHGLENYLNDLSK